MLNDEHREWCSYTYISWRVERGWGTSANKVDLKGVSAFPLIAALKGPLLLPFATTTVMVYHNQSRYFGVKNTSNT